MYMAPFGVYTLVLVRGPIFIEGMASVGFAFGACIIRMQGISRVYWFSYDMLYTHMSLYL